MRVCVCVCVCVCWGEGGGGGCGGEVHTTAGKQALKDAAAFKLGKKTAIGASGVHLQGAGDMWPRNTSAIAQADSSSLWIDSTHRFLQPEKAREQRRLQESASVLCLER